MNICIVSPGLAHDGNTLKTKSLGGSETAAIQLAEAFARQLDAFGTKNNVVVFANSESGTPVTVNDVLYIPLQGAESYLQGADIDMLIASRWQQILMKPANAKCTFFWCHDLALKRFEGQTKGIAYQVDKFLVMSEFQKQQYKDVYSLKDPHLKVIRNGVDLSLFPAPRGRKRAPGQIVYAARPERGLENLVKPGGIMDQLQESGSPIKLFVAHYDNTTEQMKPYYEMLWNRCMELPNVQLLGSLTKAQLYDLYSRSWAYVYPTEFEEISCISAMEAQACGLPFITTPVAALVETLHPDARIMIEGKACDTETQTKFCEALNDLYNDELSWSRMSKAGYSHAVDLSWDPVAIDLLDEADRVMRKRTSNPARLYKHFFEMSDIEMCKRMASEGHDLSLAQKEVDYVRDNYGFMESPEAYRAQYDKVDGPIEGTAHTGATVDHYPTSENEPRWMVVREFLRANPGKYKTVLDFGCWIGHQTIRMANEMPDASVVGFDVNARNISLAHECKEKYSKHGNVNFEVWDEMAAPEKKVQDREQFDLVQCNEVLEHVLDPGALVLTLENLCKPGGTVFLTTPYGPWEYMSYETFPYRCHVRHYEKSDLIDMFGDKKDLQVFYRQQGNDSKGRPVGHHYVCYTNDPSIPTGKVNLLRKSAWQPARETLSVCMIAYNAEDMLHRCLKSIRGIADEIIIAVDPKTTDSTRQIAERYGCKVIEGVDPIVEGFDSARNLSVEHANGDWIMWIDSDEELLNPEKIGKYLRPNIIDGYAIQQHHMSVDPPMVLKPDLPIRLFRKNPEVKFYGIVHEHPENGLNKGIGTAVVLTDTWLAHDGYLTEDVRRKRFLRNIDLVVADRKKYKDRNLGKFLWLRDLIHLSRYRLEQRNGTGPDENVFAWAREAKELFEAEYLNDPASPMLPEAVGYYSEANKILNLGHPVKFTIALQNAPSQEITAQFPDSEIASQFIRNVTKTLIAQFEGRYV